MFVWHRTGQVNLRNENKSFNWLKQNVTIADYITIQVPAQPSDNGVDSGVDGASDCGWR